MVAGAATGALLECAAVERAFTAARICIVSHFLQINKILSVVKATPKGSQFQP